MWQHPSEVRPKYLYTPIYPPMAELIVKRRDHAVYVALKVVRYERRVVLFTTAGLRVIDEAPTSNASSAR